MCAFRFHFRGRKVNWNQASHVRASSVLYRHSAIQYCNHWMMTVILWKCLNSESYVAIVFAPSACRIGWRFSLMWAFFVCRAAFCYRQLGPAGSHCLGPLCRSPLGDGTAANRVSWPYLDFDDRAKSCFFRVWLRMLGKAHVREIWGGCRSVQFANII